VEAKRDGSLAGFVGHACGATEGRGIIGALFFFFFDGGDRKRIVKRSEEIYERGGFILGWTEQGRLSLSSW
jgi:hypothetical protein